MADERISVRGVELAVERAGTGPTVVWGHGLTSDRRHEDRSGWLAHERWGADLVRYDARGHGDSGSTAEAEAYSWASLALDQLALADRLGIERYVAAGASMGCGTALHAAVLAPERVDRLLLVIPPTAWETRAEQADQWEASARFVLDRGIEALVRAQAVRPIPDPFATIPDHRERQADETRRWDPARLARVLRGAGTADLPDRAALAALDIDALVLAWTGDPVHPTSTADELSELLDAELTIASTAADLATWPEVIGAWLTG